MDSKYHLIYETVNDVNGKIYRGAHSTVNFNDGYLGSDECRRKMSESRRGKFYEKVECPHCGKIGGGSPMKRYHFDNCKQKGVN